MRNKSEFLAMVAGVALGVGMTGLFFIIYLPSYNDGVRDALSGKAKLTPTTVFTVERVKP